MTYFLIGLGGALGATLRFYFSNYFSQFVLFSIPLGTFLVNLLGCFLIGYFISNQEEEFTLWSNTLKLIDNSRYSEAAENLRFLILSYPKGAYLVDSYFWLAEIYFLQEMNEDAYETYLSLINNFPDHERVPVSLYKLGLISIKLEKNEEAIAFFERVILNYPESGSSILSEQELLKFKS